MIDINIIRDEPERVKQAMRDLYDEEALARIDLILDLDVKRRDLLQKVEELRAEKNAGFSCWSRAATATMYGLFAGGPTKPKLRLTRSALLPAAAMIRLPLSSARLPAAV